MPVQFARPDVANLQLRVFSRQLHPEFFDCHGVAAFRSGTVGLQLRLCRAGHTLEWRRGDRFVTEAITETNQDLPAQFCVLSHKVRGCRTRGLSLPQGVRYDVGCQLETLPPEVFLQLHDELRTDLLAADLGHEFPSPTRFSPGPLSLIAMEITRTSAIIHTTHTFPDHASIVKTQTLFEWD